MIVVGIAAALVASALFNVGIALQALEAKRSPRQLGLRVGLLAALLRRPLWVTGFAIEGIGIGPQVLALDYAPFVVVQPALASGLLLLLAIGAWAFNEPVGLGAVLGVGAIIVGIGLISWGAPGHSETHRGGATVVALVGVLVVIAIAPFGFRRTRFDTALTAMLSSGCGFAGANIVTKLMSDDLGASHYLNTASWAAVGLLVGAAATITGMTALQRQTASVVVPTMTAVQIFLPIVLEPLFLRESFSEADLAGAPIAAGLLITLVGTVLVSRTSAVGEVSAQANR
jgi:drug/metabolite transporter (DMT)-like permease